MTTIGRDEEESQILSSSSQSSYDPYVSKQNQRTSAESSSIGSGQELKFESAGNGNPDEQFLHKIMEAQGIKSGGHGGGPGSGDFSMGAIFIHQLIEAIEFVLGCISNTASYLRLWALSLAHSQLAKTFFTQTLGKVMASRSIPGLVILFIPFASFTFAVLLLMDVMECFLHTIRLHWVEFNNKFYKGEGYNFTPLDFEKTLEFDY